MRGWTAASAAAIVLGAVFAPAHGDQAAPTVTVLESGGDSIRVRHFPAQGQTTSASSVLLVPGWPAVAADVLGLGAALSSRGIHVFLIHPRGHAESGGEATFANALDDVALVWNWMSSPGGGGAAGLAPERRILAGYSWGGGIALALAARDPSIARVASIAGTDHGAFIRRVDSDAGYGALMRRVLESTRAPAGPVRFTVETALEELRSTVREHDLVSLAPKLLGRDILIVAGWDDDQVEIEHQVLPFYRALRRLGASSVRMLSFQDGHGFRRVRSDLAEGVYQWVVRARSSPSVPPAGRPASRR